ncbi:DUF202 domain-containing protein [Arthrobacter sp. L77]|uniref:DUF202 domain-containing protein n=1 Tax=Arthrobacter sp. L77 TaxID=1496689 RepID=UPI0005BA8BA5|nr:DUF202 domain-containing protein [Arthrobacter sp. L77]
MRGPREDPAPRPHEDPGLQPERTTLAWNRTMLALVIAGVLLLRWVPRHGWFPLGLTLLTAATALAITAGQARRYRRSARGIREGRIDADVAGVLGTTVAVALLGALALVVVVALPLR